MQKLQTEKYRPIQVKGGYRCFVAEQTLNEEEVRLRIQSIAEKLAPFLEKQQEKNNSRCKENEGMIK